jgi:uncharacterized protein YndB with AHSA1/START domain
MPSASRAITINKPIGEVFAFVGDGLNGPKWRSGVLDVSLQSGDAASKGAVYRQGVKGPGGRRIAADYEVTDYQPNRRLAFHAIAGPVRPTGSYELAATDGATKLTFSLEAELSGWKRWFMGGSVQRTMDAEMAALDTLKAVLEG